MSAGTVTYDFEVDASSRTQLGVRARAAGWLRKALGDDFFGTVVSATTSCDRHGLRPLRDLMKLRCLTLYEGTCPPETEEPERYDRSSNEALESLESPSVSGGTDVLLH